VRCANTEQLIVVNVLKSLLQNSRSLSYMRCKFYVSAFYTVLENTVFLFDFDVHPHKIIRVKRTSSTSSMKTIRLR
jgi:hypothetical protein